MTRLPPTAPGWRRFLQHPVVRRLPVLLVVAGGVWFWRGGGALFPRTRDVVWQLPAGASSVRSVDLQLWDGQELVSRRQLQFPAGAPYEVVQKVPLKDRDYTARALLQEEGKIRPTGFSRPIRVGEAQGDTVVVPLR